ncbi:DUF3558 domain-containing protein [Mycobacteroides abscessus]|uniref:DUF3558 domain-containing protein n=1 Tax=Mycobacteroides abscessus TaxID=36809 RepID=UPI0019D10E45|nr:DUF3558 domain-containing protein [Mycobacteroides abscessus]MBN7314890.1 DUF3558 domain-containing protein [Mycobacteroides abscessus subsp. abscessus]
MRSRWAWLAPAALVASCTHAGIEQNTLAPPAATTSTVATNTAGRPTITYEPCKQIPAEVVREQQLDRRAPEPDRSTDGAIENNICGYLAQARYGVTVAASNYTLDMDKKVGHFGYKEFDIGGRRALSFYLFAGNTNTCAIDVEASTGTYGVKVDSALGKFGNFPDCLTAARAHLDAFLPYFPN